jgi:hypothetical protein
LGICCGGVILLDAAFGDPGALALLAVEIFVCITAIVCRAWKHKFACPTFLFSL